jgi:sugar phosphate isomerase/epimerase
VRFGICCSVENAAEALDAGFDYVELPAAQLLEREAEYTAIAPEVTNLFFPGGYTIHGPEGQARAMSYAAETIEGASQVGVHVMVIGSGGARLAPDEESVETCEAEFVRTAARISDIAERYRIVIAPESLNRGECNVGTDLARLAGLLQVAGVAYTADSYHVLSEWVFGGNEAPPPLDHWRDQIPFLPAHVHVGSRARVDPQPDDSDLQGFVKRLSELGYDERVSLECRRFNGQSLKVALSNLRQLFQVDQG